MVSEKRTPEQIDAKIGNRLARANNIALVIYNSLHSKQYNHNVADSGDLAFAMIVNKMYDEIKKEEDSEVVISGKSEKSADDSGVELEYTHGQG